MPGFAEISIVQFIAGTLGGDGEADERNWTYASCHFTHMDNVEVISISILYVASHWETVNSSVGSSWAALVTPDTSPTLPDLGRTESALKVPSA